MQYPQGEKICEGKTKILSRVAGSDNLAIVQNKPAITAHDDPRLTQEFASKAIHATTTTCRVFELLQAAGIPVAYVCQSGQDTFVVPVCQMIPLEVVARRYKTGSYTKRHPEFTHAPDEVPAYTEDLIVEFFLKTSGGKFVDLEGKVHDLGLSPERGEEDPLISDPRKLSWHLYHSKKPPSDETAHLGIVDRRWVVKDKAHIQLMKELIVKVFETLEQAWRRLGCLLIDLKIEIGIDANGELLVADVIDNDSWRLRDKEWNELSKQLFRDGVSLGEVENRYELVAQMVEQLQ